MSENKPLTSTRGWTWSDPATWFPSFRSPQGQADLAAPREFFVLLAVTVFLLLYGLVPHFGGDQLGLVGADEPRYAQVAREMLAAHSEACHEVNAKMVPRSLRAEDLLRSYHCIVGGTVTPILYGQPWLEKPARL